MSAEKRKVWVVGHKNPDTDSICAALSYAYLKNQTENDKTYVAKRAGAVNAETHYVLDYFGAQEPELVTYAGTQIKDINFRRTAGVSSQISLRRAWETMIKLEVVVILFFRAHKVTTFFHIISINMLYFMLFNIKYLDIAILWK